MEHPQPARPDTRADPGEMAQARSERPARDILLSLLVLLVPIVVIVGFYRLLRDGEQPVVVDPAPAVAQARADGAFPVAEPVGLTGRWQTLRAAYQQVDGGAVLRIGYLTPSGAGAQLVESDVLPDRLLPQELTRRARPQGAVEVGGRIWQRYSARPGEAALVLLEPERTVLVVGSAPGQELGELAGTLR